ncbi:MAG: aldo/keto reductase, partial [Clostridia bacterium]|nr:aldo/keto reductase [Clostridia bacterium]
VVHMSEIPPAVVQVEAHPYHTQTALKTYLKTLGTVIMAWYPLGHGDRRLISEPLFAALGAKYGKSPAQIILRWHIQAGHIIIPGSKNPSHIAENIDLFDFFLAEDEMASVAALNQNTPYYTATKESLEGYLRFSPDFDAQK